MTKKRIDFYFSNPIDLRYTTACLPNNAVALIYKKKSPLPKFLVGAFVQKPSLVVTFVHSGEVELRNTLRLVNCYHGSQKTFETIIGDQIDAFRKYYTSCQLKKIKSLFEKVKLRQVPETGSRTQK